MIRLAITEIMCLDDIALITINNTTTGKISKLPNYVEIRDVTPEAYNTTYQPLRLLNDGTLVVSCNHEPGPYESGGILLIDYL